MMRASTFNQCSSLNASFAVIKGGVGNFQQIFEGGSGLKKLKRGELPQRGDPRYERGTEPVSDGITLWTPGGRALF